MEQIKIFDPIAIGTYIFTSCEDANVYHEEDWIDISKGLSYPTEKYPELAKVKPSWVSGTDIKIPDIKDRYPRVEGRHGKPDILLGDAIRNITGSFSAKVDNVPSGWWTPDLTGNNSKYQCLRNDSRRAEIVKITSSSGCFSDSYFSASRSVPTSDENRPITFMTKCYVKAGTTFYKKQMRQSILDYSHPIGSLYFTTLDPLKPEDPESDPNNIFGGTWEIWEEASGKVIAQIDRNDPKMAYAKMITGEKLHQLTIKEMPAHSHGIAYPEMQWPAIAKNQALSGYEVQGTQIKGSQTEKTGESVPISLMQPTITVVCWKRVN